MDRFSWCKQNPSGGDGQEGPPQEVPGDHVKGSKRGSTVTNRTGSFRTSLATAPEEEGEAGDTPMYVKIGAHKELASLQARTLTLTLTQP